jgi:iron donor protein CyaY
VIIGTVTDPEFQTCADAALQALNRKLALASEMHAFDADFNAGALTIEFEEPPAKFVVSPNSPVRQIWVSAHSRSFKFDWDEERGTFVLQGETLIEMMAGAISQHLKARVVL